MCGQHKSAFIKWTGWTLAIACHDDSTINVISVSIRLEAKLQPNTVFTSRRVLVLAVFTRTANSAESEPIWMKSGALWVHCRGLALADFGHDPQSSDSLTARWNYFCQVSNELFYRFPVGQISRNFGQISRNFNITSIGVAIKIFGT